MKKEKLKNAPLKEAVFELTWELRSDDDEDSVDSGFHLAQGKFEERIFGSFPVLKKVGSAKVKHRHPVYQFWKGELKWPVVHYGPGILAISDTEYEYEWEKTLAPAIKQAISVLVESYDEKLTFTKMVLKYIDAVDIEPGENDALKWISNNLQTTLQSHYELPGQPNGFRINQSFESGDGAEIQLGIESALNTSTQKKAVVWTTSVRQGGKFDLDEVRTWIENAHEKCSELFVKILNPSFYESLDR